MAEGQLKAYSIRNHLGCEVGHVETDSSEPVVAYAVKVGVNSDVFRELNYKAVELISTPSAT